MPEASPSCRKGGTNGCQTLSFGCDDCHGLLKRVEGCHLISSIPDASYRSPALPGRPAYYRNTFSCFLYCPKTLSQEKGYNHASRCSLPESAEAQRCGICLEPFLLDYLEPAPTTGQVAVSSCPLFKRRYATSWKSSLVENLKTRG